MSGVLHSRWSVSDMGIYRQLRMAVGFGSTFPRPEFLKVIPSIMRFRAKKRDESLFAERLLRRKILEVFKESDHDQFLDVCLACVEPKLRQVKHALYFFGLLTGV